MHFREVRCFFNWLVRPAISRRAPSAPSATCDSPSGSSSRSQRKRSSGSSLADFSLITAAVIELLPRILDEASRFQRAPAEADMLVLPPAQRAAASVTERSALSRDAPRSRLLCAWNYLAPRRLAYQVAPPNARAAARMMIIVGASEPAWLPEAVRRFSRLRPARHWRGWPSQCRSARSQAGAPAASDAIGRR